MLHNQRAYQLYQPLLRLVVLSKHARIELILLSLLLGGVSLVLQPFEDLEWQLARAHASRDRRLSHRLLAATPLELLIVFWCFLGARTCSSSFPGRLPLSLPSCHVLTPPRTINVNSKLPLFTAHLRYFPPYSFCQRLRTPA